MLMYLIGVDVGTSSCKAILFDLNGNIIESASSEYTVNTRRPGWVELYPDRVWNAIIKTFHSLMKGRRQTTGNRYFLAFSVLGDALIPVNTGNEVLYPAILSADTRSKEYISLIENTFGRQHIYSLTGRFPHTMTVMNRLLWMRDHLPAIFNAAHMFLDFHSWILTRLGFPAVTDYPSANGTLFFDIYRKEYITHILDWIGVSKEQFPEPTQSGTELGFLNTTYLAELGFNKLDKVSVVLGAMDQLCNALGAGSIKTNDIVCGTGTVECTTTVLPNSINKPAFYKNNFIISNSALPNQYVTFTFLWTGGGLLRWFKDNFAEKEVEWGRQLDKSPYEILLGGDRKISDLFVLPYWAGSGTPNWDSTAKGAVLGLSLSTTKQSLVNGLLEGITFDLRHNLEYLGHLGFHLPALKVTGGGARSEKWLQLKADILGVRIQMLKCEEAGCLGAAILAGFGGGLYPLHSAVSKMVSIKREFNPDDQKHHVYSQKYTLLYKNIFPHLVKINSLLHEFNSGYQLC